MFNWLQYLSGGWIPEGKRTQWLGIATFLSTVVVSVVQWGAGAMDFTHLWDVIATNWPGFVTGLGLNYVGDKIDSRAEEVKKP